MNNVNKNPNVPNLRFPDYKEKWKYQSINNLLSFQNGINADANKYGKGIKYISVGDILNDMYINYENIKGLVDIDNFTLSNYSVTYGDILFQRSSETREDIGRTNVYLDKTKIATFGGFVIRGKKIGIYDPLFFHYLLKSPSARKSIIRLGAGAQHYNIGQENLRSLHFYFPQLLEQERISSFLKKIDERIEIQIKIIEDYSLLKNSIIHQTFLMDYAKVKLNNLLTEVSVRNKENQINTVLSVSNKQGFIKQSEQFEDREVASDDTSNYKIVNKGDYAYNPARINVGSIARLINYDKGIISPMYSCFKIDQDKITYTYFDMFLNSSSFKRQLNKKLEGSVRQCLTFEGMLSMKIELPSIEVQKSISDKIDMLNNKIKIEIEYRNALIKQRQYLLNNLFI